MVERIPSGPIEQAAWYGPQVADAPQRWSYELSAGDCQELAAALEQTREIPLERLAPRMFPLPRLGPRLKQITREVKDGLGFYLLRGFPTTEYGIDDLARMYFGLSVHMGLPIGQNPKNVMVHDVRNEGDPTKFARASQRGGAQSYHSDSADMVSLLCVRPAKEGGVSKVMSAVTVHNIIQRERPDLLEVLYNEPFYYSWNGEQPEGTAPYFWTHFFSYYQDRLRTFGILEVAWKAQELYPDCPRLSEGQAEALRFVEAIQKERDAELALDMNFSPGDIQILDNALVWHGRTDFIDYDDPALRRHMLRIWLNYIDGRPTAPDAWNRHELVDQATHNPKRRLFDVETYPTW